MVHQFLFVPIKLVQYHKKEKIKKKSMLNTNEIE